MDQRNAFVKGFLRNYGCKRPGAINAIVDKAQRSDLPENLTLTITQDQSDQTRTQVSELENSIIFGVLLVVGVLLFFLGLRNALFVGVAIPLSMESWTGAMGLETLSSMCSSDQMYSINRTARGRQVRLCSRSRELALAACSPPE